MNYSNLCFLRLLQSKEWRASSLVRVQAAALKSTQVEFRFKPMGIREEVRERATSLYTKKKYENIQTMRNRVSAFSPLSGGE